MIDFDFTVLTNDNEPSPPIQEKEQINEIDICSTKEKESPLNEVISETSIITTENDEERLALEMAIERSLEDQRKLTIENSNDISNTTESSSDSDGK